jgi:hypothetical protein
MKSAAELMDELAAAEEASNVTDILSTFDLPPGTSRRTFVTEARSGKFKSARKVGKVWFVDRAEWFEVRSQRPPHHATKPANDADVDLDALLANAGIRPTRRAG